MQLLIIKMPHLVALASHIFSTHKGRGFRYVQADNKCYLSAGAATCIEFKVSFDFLTNVLISDLQIVYGATKSNGSTIIRVFS